MSIQPTYEFNAPWRWTNAHHADTNLVDKDGALIVSCYWNISPCGRGHYEHLLRAAPNLLETMEELQEWAAAYPVEVFPEPDFAKAHKVLTENGMTLDSISASNFRFVLKRMMEIIGPALAEANGGDA